MDTGSNPSDCGLELGSLNKASGCFAIISACIGCIRVRVRITDKMSMGMELGFLVCECGAQLLAPDLPCRLFDGIHGAFP